MSGCLSGMSCMVAGSRLPWLSTIGEGLVTGGALLSRWRHTVCRGVAVGTLLCWLVVPVQASRPFGLPECVGELGSEVVVNAPMLDAMIPLAEPDGTQPNRQYAMLFIISKYYLERSRGLLVISRDR